MAQKSMIGVLFLKALILLTMLLILVMIFRPTGLVAFKEFDIQKLIRPKLKNRSEV